MGYTFRLFRAEGVMPWKASSVMEERLRFVARLLDGDAMTDVCREFGISRKTGYKIFDRYKVTEQHYNRSQRIELKAEGMALWVRALLLAYKKEKQKFRDLRQAKLAA